MTDRRPARCGGDHIKTKEEEEGMFVLGEGHEEGQG